MKTTITLGEVEFTNFPGHRDEQGEITWSLMESVVAERYANRFGEKDREAITVNWDKIPADVKQQVFEEAKADLGIRNPFSTEEEAREAEQLLLHQLAEAGFFSTEAVTAE